MPNANRPYSKRLNQSSTLMPITRWRRGSGSRGLRVQKTGRRPALARGSLRADAATTTREHSASRMATDASEDFNARVDYAYSARRAPDYNENAFLALVPYANVSPATATGGATALLVHECERLEWMRARGRLRRHHRQHEPVLPEQQRPGQRAVREQQQDQRTARAWGGSFLVADRNPQRQARKYRP